MLLLLLKPANAPLITYSSETPPNVFLFIINFHFQSRDYYKNDRINYYHAEA